MWVRLLLKAQLKFILIVPEEKANYLAFVRSRSCFEVDYELEK